MRQNCNERTAGAGGSTAWKINTKGIARSASTKTALLHLLQRRSDADQKRNYGHALSGVTAGASKKNDAAARKKPAPNVNRFIPSLTLET
jgi:hypothetical protein